DYYCQVSDSSVVFF
nr:immunoglobulin light chain junction region [Macaca mulatta]MOW38186.1 immunoglobulin light chain junction region [Macaca mulatta]MOW39033.1 immunoglobulin light chain junction region [Macaca mulatta]